MPFPLIPIAMAVSALTSIIGGVSANNKRRQAERQLSDRQRKLDEWYRDEMNTSYLDRADSRAMLKRIREYNADTMKALSTNAIKAGATDEAKVAAASRLNRNYSGAVAQIAGLGAQHKDAVTRQYRAEKAGLENTRYAAKLGEMDGVQNMVSGLGNAAGTLTMIYGMGNGKVTPTKVRSFDPIIPSGANYPVGLPVKLHDTGLAGIRRYGQS